MLGYDAGDPYYDAEVGQTHLKDWIKVRRRIDASCLWENDWVVGLFRHTPNGPSQKQEVHDCMATLSEIQVDLTAVRVVNPLKKPGPVFIEMARVAYDLGAEYFFRVNDDTEMLHPWTSAFIGALQVRG